MNKLSNKYANKRVFITGGASGIGQALAYRFAGAGWKVAIADINVERLNETAAQIKQLGGEPQVFELNVTSRDDWEATRALIESRWGGIDLLFNNAGIAGTSGSFETHGIDEWQRTTDINYWSVVYGCTTFLPMMKAQGTGHVINTASAAGILAAGEMAAYNATKAAVIAMTETLFKELRSLGMSASVICPTVVNTNINESKVGSSATGDAVLNQVKASTFSADDAAQVIINKVSKEQLYIFTRFDGSFMWAFKRLMPQACAALVGWMQHNRLWIFK